MQKKGILVCGHGSRKQEGIQGLINFTNSLQQAKPEYIVTCCFLDLSDPDFQTSINDLYAQGVREVIAAPAFLLGGIHVNLELPSLIENASQAFSDLKIVLGDYIGLTDPIVNLCVKNAQAAVSNDELLNVSNYCLLTVGAGASLSAANGDIAKLTRIVWEAVGFGLGQYSFVSRVTFPSVNEMLELLSKHSFEKIVVLPLLFFPGVYVDKIYLAVEQIRLQKGIDIVIAEPLGSDSLLLDAFLLRIKEAEKLL